MNKAMNMIKKLWNDGGVRRMLLTFAATELVCSGLMVGVFALLGKYTPQVAVGAIVGSVLAVANFAVLSIGVEKSVEAFDREGNPAGAKLAVQLSSSVRPLGLFCRCRPRIPPVTHSMTITRKEETVVCVMGIPPRIGMVK